jgi:hypothetical protein
MNSHMWSRYSIYTRKAVLCNTNLQWTFRVLREPTKESLSVPSMIRLQISILYVMIDSFVKVGRDIMRLQAITSLYFGVVSNTMCSSETRPLFIYISFTVDTGMDLLGALLGGGPGGRVLAHAPRNSTVEVFPSCPRMYHCHTTHAQVTSHNSA